MRSLLDRTLAPFGIEDERRFKLDGPDIKLSSRLIVGLALALHELATNATKYGALSKEAGVVRIEWNVENDWHPHRLHLNWIEAGGPAVEIPSRTGFGTQLIQRVLAHQTGGTAKLSYEPEGVRFSVVAPLPDPTTADISDTSDIALT